jgi:hypothetical protein
MQKVLLSLPRKNKTKARIVFGEREKIPRPRIDFGARNSLNKFHFCRGGRGGSASENLFLSFSTFQIGARSFPLASLDPSKSIGFRPEDEEARKVACGFASLYSQSPSKQFIYHSARAHLKLLMEFFLSLHSRAKNFSVVKMSYEHQKEVYKSP